MAWEGDHDQVGWGFVVRRKQWSYLRGGERRTPATRPRALDGTGVAGRAWGDLAPAGSAAQPSGVAKHGRGVAAREVRRGTTTWRRKGIWLLGGAGARDRWGLAAAEAGGEE
ncbi:hypothetical protein Rhe02_75930 [Rhizocola hellebori]|uniref:Uncharacterized protein n=1 Tax=Rhizocola hellebori TaxID=1392758 RepID=A0A8J3QF05_9ACTN|nr:hypothetical protein Rhe02_75930 [Rhizocola hellebori]